MKSKVSSPLLVSLELALLLAAFFLIPYNIELILRVAELGLKCLLVGIFFFVLPYLAGQLPVTLWHWHRRGVASCIVFGTVVLWAVFLAIAMPYILLWGSFAGLVQWVSVVWFVLAAVPFVILGGRVWTPLIRLGRRLRRALRRGERGAAVLPTLVTACMALMIAVPVIMEHRDEDDSSYVTLATDTVQSGKIYGYLPQTGESTDDKDGRRRPELAAGWQRIVAPFSQLSAYYSSVTAFHPCIVSHTIMPGTLIPLAFMVYFLLARQLFRVPEERWIFLLILCVALSFGGYSAWSTGSFLLLRIWQGKPLLAAVLLPLLLLLLLREYREGPSLRLWFAIFVLCWAAALTTLMTSIFVPFLLTAASLLSLRQYQSPARALALFLACAPAAAQGLAYYFLTK